MFMNHAGRPGAPRPTQSVQAVPTLQKELAQSRVHAASALVS